MNKLYDDTAVQAIANAIRSKNGNFDTYTIAEMSTALNDLSYYAKPTIENVPLATFEADGLPLNSLKVSVVAKQASGTPSPSNPLPISGWDNAIVTDTGINIWDEDWDLGGIDPNTGQNVGGNLVRSKNYIAASADTTYYFKGVGRVFYYDDQKNYISRSDRNNNEFTTPNNCKYIRFRMDASYGTTYNNDISINYPSTDTNYHAYNGTTTTISLGQTVYGGEVDVVNGILKITDGYIASYNGETLPSTWISSMDEYVEGTTPTTGAEVCYELAEPIITNLTPNLIKSLNDINNLSVDCGEVIELEYFKEV